nr:hypothetical protein Hi04_10k_c5203_00033 [uncultured bacterium]
MKLDDIALAAQAEFERAHRQPACYANAGPGFIGTFMRPLVKDISLGGEFVVAPDLLDMNERALPLAKQQMLKRGNRQKLLFAKWHRGNGTIKPGESA